MMGIRGMEWKAMVAVTEGMKYWEAKRWICLKEAGVSKKKKGSRSGGEDAMKR